MSQDPALDYRSENNYNGHLFAALPDDWTGEDGESEEDWELQDPTDDDLQSDDDATNEGLPPDDHDWTAYDEDEI